ncbi:thiamine phosphate synthase [Flavobacterium antarcticum]|uniref:thiamine phosphate synthase n=1 Tax=Flavobacterium antarcticum TaxID=271155 RepID=UPI0003B7BB77|nr:thiamine phosphate synthase [Flavobacterium antarcticum]
MIVPKLQYISQGATTQEHLEHIQKACSAGVELVQLRLKNISDEAFLAAAKEARTITAHFQTRLIVNDNYKIAKEVNADGVHLGQSDSDPGEARAYLGNFYMIGGTANTLEECQILIEKGVNYIGLGPFKFTTTKQNLGPVLGLEGYEAILDELKTETPIFAIGGIALDDVTDLMRTGIYGIATSTMLTADFNNVSKLHTFLKGADFMEEVWNNNSPE